MELWEEGVVRIESLEVRGREGGREGGRTEEK